MSLFLHYYKCHYISYNTTTLAPACNRKIRKRIPSTVQSSKHQNKTKSSPSIQHIGTYSQAKGKSEIWQIANAKKKAKCVQLLVDAAPFYNGRCNLQRL